MNDEEDTKQNFLDKMIETQMKKVSESMGMPKCLLCQKAIMGVHIDYMTQERVAEKICVGCCSKCVDYFLNMRAQRAQIKG